MNDKIKERKKAKSLFVTGTGTDVGKTFVTALIKFVKNITMSPWRAAEAFYVLLPLMERRYS